MISEAMPEGALCSWQVQPSQTGHWGRGQTKHASSILGSLAQGKQLGTVKKDFVMETAMKTSTTTVCDALPESRGWPVPVTDRDGGSS